MYGFLERKGLVTSSLSLSPLPPPLSRTSALGDLGVGREVREVRPDDDADDDHSDQCWEPKVAERRPRTPADS